MPFEITVEGPSPATLRLAGDLEKFTPISFYRDGSMRLK